jgi:hypothetical protein
VPAKATKKPLHPALQANADRLKRGEPLHKGRHKPTSVGSAGVPPAKPKIRSAKSRKG